MQIDEVFHQLLSGVDTTGAPDARIWASRFAKALPATVKKIAVLDELLATVAERVRAGHGHFAADAVRVFWVHFEIVGRGIHRVVLDAPGASHGA